MPSSKNSNVHRQAAPDSPVYYRPLLQLDNSLSWTTELPSPVHLDRPPDSSPNLQFLTHIQHEAIANDDDDGPPTKHDGRLISVTPTPVASPSPRPASSVLSPSPPTSFGHTRSPVLARSVVFFLTQTCFPIVVHDPWSHFPI